MPDEQPEYQIDRLKAFLGLSFALSLVSKYVASNSVGSSDARIADDLGTVFGLLTIVLLIALMVRTVLRWQRTAKAQGKLPLSASPHLPLGMMLLGVGVGLLGFIFGEPEYPLAGFRRELEDMRIFGIESLQYKWVLAASICLVLIGIFLYSIQKRPSSK